MNKIESVSRPRSFTCLTHANRIRIKRRGGWVEILALMMSTLMLAACDNSTTSSDAAADSGSTPTPLDSVQMIAFSRDAGGQLDLFAIAEDGTGGLVTLADDPGDEVFGGSTNDNRIVYVRDTGGGLNDIFSINDDGSGVPVMLTNDPRDELPVAVTAANEVVFMRTTVAPPDSDLFSISADGSSGEMTLAISTDAEVLDRLTADGRVIFHRFEGGSQFDIYSNLTDGTGSVMPLANTPAIDEISAGVTVGNLVVFARTVTAGIPSDNDIFTIDADGLSLESLLVSTTDDEVPVDVTAGGRVIFIRSTLLTMNLFSIDASGGPVTQLTSSGDILFYGGSTAGGHAIFNRLNPLSFQFDVFSIKADGTEIEVALATDPVNNEAFSGISSDGLVIFTRTVGAQTDLIAINADGTGGEISLAADPVNTETFLGVTINGRVIFERSVGGQTNLYSIMADGSAPEVPLSTAATFGGIF